MKSQGCEVNLVMLRNAALASDCSALVRSVGWLAIGGNAFAVFSLLMFEFQSGGHGEMGSFYHRNMLWFLAFAGWGFATGIGLLRAWRWARISTLIFSGLLAGLGIVGVIAFLRMPGGDVSGATLLVARILSALLFAVPTAIAYRWLVFFNRKDVKAYFGAKPKSSAG